jgi:pimeloyl-ACP methyl ester carboxylesterase
MPRPRLRLALPLLVASVLALALLVALAAPAVAQAPPDSVAFEPIAFELARDSTVAAEEGTVFVPERRSDPDSRTIPIRFVRFASRAETPAAPILYLAGGPGGSGTRAARGRRWDLFERLRDVADVVVVDQRGTGRSDAMPYCADRTPWPEDEVLTRAAYVRVHREAAARCLRFWRTETDADLRGYTTAESAADLDAVRRALGAERVSLLGISYGTHLALATLKRYPERIDRLVLASPEGLDQTVKLPARTDAYFARLQAALDADSAAAARYPDVRGLVADVLDQMAADPPTVTVDADEDGGYRLTLGRFPMQRFIGYLISDPRTVPFLLDVLTDVQAGETASLARLADYFTSAQIGFDGMALGMDVASGVSPERLAQVEAQAETALLGDALNFPMPHLRDAMPGHALGPAFRAPVASDRPALLLAGTLDGRTYPEAHAEVAAGLAASAVVTIEHAGHNLFFSHPDVPALVADFFAGAPPQPRTLTAPLPAFVRGE